MINALKLATPERNLKLLHTASRVARMSAAVLDPDELLRWMVEALCTEFGYDYAAVFLIDETDQWAVLRSAYGVGANAIASAGHKLVVGGNSMVGLVTRLREPRIVRNADEDEAGLLRTPYFPEACSELALPLIVADEVLGAINLKSAQPDAFCQEDVVSIQSMADQLAVALRYSRMNRQNQELIRRAERRARLLQAANEVGKQVASILILDSLLPKTVDIICEAYGFYYAGVFLVDESGQWAVLRAGHGEAGAAMIARQHKLAVGGHSMVGMATSLGEARIALDVGEERVHFKNPLLPFTRSEVALPLMVGNRVVGAVTVQSIEERAFTEDDLMTLQTMADHLAVAINNARLLKELEKANTELLRTKTYEALTASTTKAIHWIGNKALPITTAVARMHKDLQSDSFDRKSLLEDLDMIAESSRLIIEIKENLLGSAREEKPRAAYLDDVVRAAAFHAGIPSAKMSITLEPHTPPALADTTQFARALSNLFRNSLEASASHIHVTVAPTVARDYVMVTIEDDGEGIAPQVMETMWAAFMTTRGHSHTGLGLPASLHVITQLHGRITVTSQPGQGTIFTIILPATTAGEPASEVTYRSVPTQIGLIDDADDWATSITEHLARAGKQVTRIEAVQDIGKLAEVDTILVDEVQTGLALDEVLAALKTTGLAGKAMVVTPVMKVERTTAYLQAGIKDVVLKPYTATELADLLTR